MLIVDDFAVTAKCRTAKQLCSFTLICV